MTYDTVRLLNTNCDELNHDGVSYKPDPSGAFNVPESVAAVVTHGPGGFYRAGPAPAPRPPLPFNPASVSRGVTIANDVSGRLWRCWSWHTLPAWASTTCLSPTPPASGRRSVRPNAAPSAANTARG